MIRAFKVSDTEDIMAIWLDATKKAHFFIDEDYWVKAAQVVRKKYIPFAETYVYEADDKILGFISLLSGDTIGGLFVDTKHHRRGIGKALVDYAKCKYDFLSVSVFKKNMNGREFYKKEGFVFDYEQNDINTGEVEHVCNWDKDSKVECE